ncbi:MAG: nickel pincer cofactor biosynthesis protein LarB [Lentisphaerae bacterium]|nr:nickel pincer cofactor biosynthesis protein LarB [Lentisphaerota bacterium]
MDQPHDLKMLLEQVAGGKLAPDDALRRLQTPAEDDLGFARVDLARQKRCRVPEVIYCPGKTVPQIVAVMRALHAARQPVLGTRATPEQYQAVQRDLPDAVYHEAARAITLPLPAPVELTGQVAVVCAGTSDIPVAEEAALTSEWLGARTDRMYDVGVAGLHRLVNRLDQLRRARVVVVVAGMEGALPSVVAGLLEAPVIAVPTSIGYGASLQGVAALLAMLNSCVPGITVVNIDNGFGAGVAAAAINRLK